MRQPVPYPRFSSGELERRRALVREAMERRGVDQLVVYARGPSTELGWLTEWPGTREAALVLGHQGAPVLLVQLNNHVPNARRLATDVEVRAAGPDTAAALAGLLRGRVGVAGPLPWTYAKRIGAELLDLTGEVRRLRMPMSGEELDRMRIAARLTDLAMSALEREVRPGLREDALGAVVESAYGREGGTHAIHFMATTPMRAPAIGVPAQVASQRVIERGDVLITEIGAAYWGYAGQLHRAYAIGEPPTPEYRRLHDVAVEAFERIVGVLCEGATTEEVLAAADVIAERGLSVYDDLFHGTDQLPPILQTHQTQRGPVVQHTFRAGDVVVVQPNVIADGGRMGLQVGETVIVTRDGVERIHRYPMRFVECG